MGRVRRNLIGLLMAAAGGLLGACHPSGNGGAPLIKRHAGGSAGAGAAVQGPSDLVSAVSLGGSGEGPVSLKFQLRQRPVAGQRIAMILHLVANQPTEHLEARFHADDGLDITQGGDFDPEGHLDARSAVDHSVALEAAHEGVYTVMATVTTGSAADAVSHSFVIPVVVGPPAAPVNASAAKVP